jgi:type II secretory pathway component PulM
MITGGLGAALLVILVFFAFMATIFATVVHAESTLEQAAAVLVPVDEPAPTTPATGDGRLAA